MKMLKFVLLKVKMFILFCKICVTLQIIETRSREEKINDLNNMVANKFVVLFHQEFLYLNIFVCRITKNFNRSSLQSSYYSQSIWWWIFSFIAVAAATVTAATIRARCSFFKNSVRTHSQSASACIHLESNSSHCLWRYTVKTGSPWIGTVPSQQLRIEKNRLCSKR